MMKLEWDSELASIAQRLADQCKYGHDCSSCRKVSRFNVGQNIFITYGYLKDGTDWNKALRAWFDDEINLFPTSYISPFRYIQKTGHYSQLIWAETTKVGCGFTSYTSGQFVARLYVCNYGPGGNRIGGEMYRIGQSCTRCPSQSTCSFTYPGLCASSPSSFSSSSFIPTSFNLSSFNPASYNPSSFSSSSSFEPSSFNPASSFVPSSFSPSSFSPSSSFSLFPSSSSFSSFPSSSSFSSFPSPSSISLSSFPSSSSFSSFPSSSSSSSFSSYPSSSFSSSSSSFFSRNGKSLSFQDGKQEQDGQEHEEQEYLKEQEQDGQESLEQEPLEEQTKLEELQEEKIFKDLINPTSVEV
ncbi:cell wall protein PRY3 isoform X2 [Eurytemora carolleeae]|nr:cell wall protein PRY3 isoform X2 [Eurytemora carolleeae]|eukprot:XP_023336492.1 cell wall protein PRY3-like isoform X2 [Eurytemora affinis]